MYSSLRRLRLQLLNTDLDCASAMTERIGSPARAEPNNAQPKVSKRKPRKTGGCYRPEYSTEDGDITGRSRRPARGRGGFQQYSKGRDNWRTPESVREAPQERGNTTRDTSARLCASSHEHSTAAGGEINRETRGLENRSAVQPLDLQSDFETESSMSSATRHSQVYSLPRMPPLKLSNSLRFVHSYGFQKSPCIDQAHRSLELEPSSTRMPATLRQWQQANPQNLSQETSSKLTQQRQMQTSHPNRPDASIERTDINPTSPRRGLDALMNNAFRGISRPRTVSPPPAPCATELYISQAKLPCVVRDLPQRLLLVLDLNGTLIARRVRHQPELFDRRPGLSKFFKYIFGHHSVMIYTSSQPKTVSVILPMLFTPQQQRRLVAVWDRTKLDLTPQQYSEKVQVYKRLEKIWTDPDIQATYPKKEKIGEWNQMNTVLIDDSELKALAQPCNLLQVPEFVKDTTKKNRQKEEQILHSVIVKLEQLKYQTDVSRLIRLWQVGKAEPLKAPLVDVDAPSREVTTELLNDRISSRGGSETSVGQGDHNPSGAKWQTEGSASPSSSGGVPIGQVDGEGSEKPR